MRRIRASLLVSAFTAVFVFIIGSLRFAGAEVSDSTKTAQGLAAWDQVYSVLTSPRCINCHTATNYPQQADDRHRHVANVVRGPGGKGVPGLNCASCHQETNADSTGVPGGHNWHLAPLSMRWQDTSDQLLSSTQICRAPPLTHEQFVAATRRWVEAGTPCPTGK